MGIQRVLWVSIEYFWTNGLTFWFVSGFIQLWYLFVTSGVTEWSRQNGLYLEEEHLNWALSPCIVTVASVCFIELDMTAVMSTEIPDEIYEITKVIIILCLSNWAFISSHLYDELIMKAKFPLTLQQQWTQTHLHQHKYARVHTHTRTHTFLKGMNNSTRERGVWGAVWHITGSNLPVARGSAEWPQLGGWVGGQGCWGPSATDRHRQGAEVAEKSTTHTHTHTGTLKHIHTYSRWLPRCCLSLRYQGKAAACQGYATPGCQLQLPSMRVLFFCSRCSVFWHLSPCSLCMSMLCPASMTRASHSARWTSHVANLHSLDKSWSCQHFGKQMSFPPNNFAQTHCGHAVHLEVQVLNHIINTFCNPSMAKRYIYIIYNIYKYIYNIYTGLSQKIRILW